MKRVFGLVGYACNGKSEIIKQIINRKDYFFVDLPKVYKYEAAKNGYDGVTEWYTAVGLERFEEESKEAVLKYIDKELPRVSNIIIDDIFDIDVYNRLVEIFPHIKLIAFHSKYEDRLNRLKVRAGIEDDNEARIGLELRDNMKRYCGIEEIFPHCKFEIKNKWSIEAAKKIFENEIKRNLIVSIVGFSGSGKSSIVGYLKDYFNIPVFEYGKEVTAIINENGFKRSRDYLKSHTIEEYRDLVESNMKARIKKFASKNKFFIIDGIVSKEIYDEIVRKNDVCSIYIKVDKEERIKRIMKRENQTYDEALKNLETKDNIKILCGLDMIVSQCKNVIDNNHDLSEALDAVSKIIETYNQ